MQIEGQRVKELADELGFNKQELVSRINDLELGFTVDNFMSRLDENEVKELKEALEDADQGGAGDAKAEASEAEGEEGDAGIGPTVIRRKGDEEPADEEAEEADVAAEAEGEPEADEEPPAGVVRRSSDEAEEGEAAEAEEREEEPAEAESAEPAEEGDETDEEADQAAVAETAEEVETTAGEQEAEVVEESEAPEAEEDEPEVEAEAEEPEEVEEAGEAEQKEEIEKKADEGEQEPPEETEAAEAERAKRPEDDQQAAEEEDGAEVTGRINQDVIKDRLAAEGKDFGPEEEEEEEEAEPEPQGDDRSNRSRHRTRQVVEGQDLYEGDSPSQRRSNRSGGGSQQQETQITEAAEHKRVIEMEDVITVGDLAHEMGVKAGEVAMKLMESGMSATVNTTLDYDTATLVADEYGYQVENTAFDIEDFYDTEADPDEELASRAPVVTVMGHVDHGKTTLLDAFRKSDVAEEEVGGITQHIGAYQVDTGDGKVTFLDTPGHEAFTALRARGAKATDIVVLVVAADDGVMPQTVEAINHAQDADVPMVVAINKVDKPRANPDRIKQALTEYELVPEEWGGTTQYVDVSALEGTNVEELLESIQLQAEIEEFRANPDRQAQGLVIEAELDRGRGAVASVLVQRGTLHDGDILVSGQHYGSVRTMHDERGRAVEEAGPSEPVEITGLNGVPEAGEPFFVVEDESAAQRITENVEEQRRKEQMANRANDVAAGGIEDLSAMIQAGDIKELKVIIKGDVQGSVEALKEAFDNLGNEDAQVEVIHSGVGSVTENDVNLAASSETAAVIVGFNVRPDQRAANIAEKQGVEILTHDVIYDAIDQVESILEGLLEPITQENILGRVEVRELFESGAAGTIAGCYVQDGTVNRDAHARVLREGRVVGDTEIASLRRFEEDVKEVNEGYECGMTLQGLNDIEIGDEIEVYEYEQVSATLE